MPVARLLPHPAGSNGWWEILDKPSPPRVQSGPLRVHTAIIGGGICGVSTANRLAELRPDDAICILEADRIGHGASGRNAGFMLNLHSHGVPKSLKTLRRNIQLWETGLASLRNKVATWQIQCNWSDAGRIYGAAGPDGQKHIGEIAETLDALAQSYRWLDQSDMQARVGTSFYARGLHASGNALVNPAALMRGLAKNLPSNVAVFEHTPVTGFERQGTGFLVHTPKGSVHCDRLVVAAGVYMAHFGIGTGRFVPMATYASLTDPLGEDILAHLGNGQEFGLFGASEFGSTIRLTQDKRLFVRNHFNFEPSQAANDARMTRIKAMHRQAMASRWPALADLPFRHSWGGTMAFTRNNGTVFGEYQPGLFAVLTNDVSPMTRGEAAGGLLAEHMEGLDSDLLALQLSMPLASRLPPRPFLDVGIGLRRYYLAKVAGREL